MAPSGPTAVNPAEYRDKVWVTRPQPGVDRMSSAWLIWRFVDSKARFVFGLPTATPDAIPFDTFEAEFGHHGTSCTFETFCDRFAIADPAVRHIGRIVHDLVLGGRVGRSGDEHHRLPPAAHDLLLDPLEVFPGFRRRRQDICGVLQQHRTGALKAPPRLDPCVGPLRGQEKQQAEPFTSRYTGCIDHILLT